MDYAITFLVALIVTGGSTAALSLVLFGDYKEGFRILLHNFNSPDVSDPPLPPEEPKASGTAQILFIGAIACVALLSFASSFYWMKRLTS